MNRLSNEGEVLNSIKRTPARTWAELTRTGKDLIEVAPTFTAMLQRIAAQPAFTGPAQTSAAVIESATAPVSRGLELVQSHRPTVRSSGTPPALRQ